MSSRVIADETSGELLQKESLTLTLYENAAACCKKGLKITLQQAAVPPLAGFSVRNFNRSIIRSLTPQQAAGIALAIADQEKRRDLSAKKYLTEET